MDGRASQRDHEPALRRLPPAGDLLSVLVALTARSSGRGVLASAKSAIHGSELTWIGRQERPIHVRRTWPEVNQIRQMFVDGAYDFELLPESVDHVIDLGANVGLSGRWFRRRFPTAKLVLVEPDAGNVELVRRNHAGDAGVVVVQAAVTSTPGTVRLATEGRQSDSFVVASEGVEVRGTTVAELIAEHCGSGTILVKMDIEGSELEVFDGDTSWLGSISYLAAELHDRLRPGCSSAFYRAVLPYLHAQEVRGENVLIELGRPAAPPA